MAQSTLNIIFTTRKSAGLEKVVGSWANVPKPKKDLTRFVSVIDGDEIENREALPVSNALQGSVAKGVSVDPRSQATRASSKIS